MSVYTEVSTQDLQQLVQRYRAGDLHSFHGIRDGIENTNYFVTTSSGDYVLTLFEHGAPSEIEFALTVMSQLARQGLPCAEPLTDRQGRYLNPLSHKPASLVTRLQGQSVQQPTIAHCQAVGETLAHMHLAGQAIQAPHNNPRGQSGDSVLPNKSAFGLLQTSLNCSMTSSAISNRPLPNCPAVLSMPTCFGIMCSSRAPN